MRNPARVFGADGPYRVRNAFEDLEQSILFLTDDNLGLGALDEREYALLEAMYQLSRILHDCRERILNGPYDSDDD